MNNKNTVVFTSLLACVFATSSYAEFKPAVIKAGGVDIVPVVSVSESYDSNILYSETAKKSDLITRVSPTVVAKIESGANTYSLKAGAVVERFSKSSEDNFINSDVAIDLNQSFTRRATLNVKAKRLNAHEERGLNYSRGIGSLSKPDAYSVNQADVKFSYGSGDSIGKIVVNAAADTRVFSTRRDITKSRDLEKRRAGATFYYHVMPKTSLLFEFSQRQLRYRNNETDNSTEQRFFVGTRWDISALTSGTAKAGLLTKKFTDIGKPALSTFSWEVGARWSPLTYSVFDVITKGLFEESDDASNYYVDSKSVLLQWVHFWSKSVDTTVHANVLNRAYQQTGRDDSLKSVGMNVNYHFRRWMDVGMGYAYSDNQSNIMGYSYDKNLFLLTVKLGL